MNKQLSIAIPTFNRLAIFKKNLMDTMRLVRPYNIPIYISDDSDNDRIKNLVKEVLEDYEYIFYSHNYPALKHDLNYCRALQLPQSDYVWLIGDSVKFNDKAIEKVLTVIEKSKPNIISVNAENRNIDNDEFISIDSNQVFNNFGWHLTYTGTTIFPRDAIEYSKNIDYSPFKNFPQIATVFCYLAKQCNFYWINDDLLVTDQKKISYWYQESFRTFIYDWENAVHALPNNYDLSLKQKVILDHSKESKIFSIRSLLKLKSYDAYNITILRSFRSSLLKHSGINIIVLILIASISGSFVRKVADFFGAGRLRQTSLEE